MQKLLFICSKNQWRSPTAEKIFSTYQNVSVRSAGTSLKARRTVKRRDIEWADMIFVMEQKHKDRLKAGFSQVLDRKQIRVLDIPDEYQFMDAELVDLLRQSIEMYLE